MCGKRKVYAMLQDTTVSVEITETIHASVALRGAFEFNATRKELGAVARTLLAISDSKSTMTVLAKLLVRVTSVGVLFASTDLNTYATIEANTLVKGGNGGVLVDAKAFAAAVRTLPDALVNVCALPGRLEMTCQGVVTSVEAMSDRDYVKFPTWDDTARMGVDGPTLIGALESVSYAVCEDITRFHLNGIFIKRDGNRLITVATDGHRLAKCERYLPAQDRTFAIERILSAGSAKHVIKTFGKANVVDLYQTGSHLAFSVSIKGFVTTVWGKCIDAKFPVYEQVIPGQGAATRLITTARLPLIAALKRAESVLGKQAKRGATGAAFEFPASAHGPQGFIRLHTAKDGKAADEKLGAEVVGMTTKHWDAHTFGANPAYVREALESITDERVMLLVSDDLAPILIRGMSGYDTLAVVMPMRIK